MEFMVGRETERQDLLYLLTLIIERVILVQVDVLCTIFVNTPPHLSMLFSLNRLPNLIFKSSSTLSAKLKYKDLFFAKEHQPQSYELDEGRPKPKC